MDRWQPYLNSIFTFMAGEIPQNMGEPGKPDIQHGMRSEGSTYGSEHIVQLFFFFPPFVFHQHHERINSVWTGTLPLFCTWVSLFSSSAPRLLPTGRSSFPYCPKTGAYRGYSHHCHLLFKPIKLTWMNLLVTNKGMLTQTAVQAGSKGCLALGGEGVGSGGQGVPQMSSYSRNIQQVDLKEDVCPQPLKAIRLEPWVVWCIWE